MSDLSSPSTSRGPAQRRQRPDNVTAMTSPPPLPNRNPEQPGAKEDPYENDHDNRSSTDVYEVIRENPYDVLGPQYANADFNPETDAYTELQSRSAK